MSKKPSLEELATLCAQVDPEDGVDPRKLFHKNQRKGNDHKTQQLCKQTAIAVGLAMAAETTESILRELHVVAVEPAPNASRLRVVVSAGPAHELAPTEVLAALERAAGRLRSEVAESIHRKRVPLLAFDFRQDAEVEP